MAGAPFFRKHLRRPAYSEIVINNTAPPPASGVATEPTMPLHTDHDISRFSLQERYMHATQSDARERVCLTLRVYSVDALEIRRTLHRALRGRIGVYVMEVDHARQVTSLQLQARRDDIDVIMQSVMSQLPRAEFGAIRATALAAVH